jgi:hypothetical protein
VYLPGLMNGILIAIAITLVSIVLRRADCPLLLTFLCQGLTGGIMQIVLVFIFPHPILKEEIKKLIAKIDLSKINNKLLNRYMSSYVDFIGAKA